MILKDFITRCTATAPVIIGHSDVNRHGRPIYTTQRYKDPSIISGPILSTYVRSWYIKDGHIMIECSSIPESTKEYVGAMYRTGRCQMSYEFDSEEPCYYRKGDNHGEKQEDRQYITGS